MYFPLSRPDHADDHIGDSLGKRSQEYGNYFSHGYGDMDNLHAPCEAKPGDYKFRIRPSLEHRCRAGQRWGWLWFRRYASRCVFSLGFAVGLFGQPDNSILGYLGHVDRASYIADPLDGVCSKLFGKFDEFLDTLSGTQGFQFFMPRLRSRCFPLHILSPYIDLSDDGQLGNMDVRHFHMQGRDTDEQDDIDGDTSVLLKADKETRREPRATFREDRDSGVRLVLIKHQLRPRLSSARWEVSTGRISYVGVSRLSKIVRTPSWESRSRIGCAVAAEGEQNLIVKRGDFTLVIGIFTIPVIRDSAISRYGRLILRDVKGDNSASGLRMSNCYLRQGDGYPQQLLINEVHVTTQDECIGLTDSAGRLKIIGANVVLKLGHNYYAVIGLTPDQRAEPTHIHLPAR
jgi:hypothetical protein